MKKTLSVLMALVLALSMCAGTMVTAFAADPVSLTVKSSATIVSVNDTITVTVDLSENSRLGTLQFNLQYDSTALQPIPPVVDPDFEDSKGASDGFFGMVVTNWEVPGKIGYNGIHVGTVKNGGTILTVTFKVLKPVSTLSLGITAATDNNDQSVAVSTNTISLSCSHASTTSVETKAPTCTEAGVQTVTCSVCGEVLGTESIPATGHNFGAWSVVKEATCAEEGVEERVCADCGERETRPIAKTAHTPGEWVVTKEPTCTEDGEKVQKCTVCDVVLATEVIPALGHSVADDAWTITKEPTCTEDGEKEGVCEVCGETVVEVIPALGHTVADDAWTVTKEPTCTEDGEKEGVCEVCGETAVEAIPALGHDFGEWVVVKEATETEEGLKERVCAVCGEKETEVIPKLTAEGEGVTGDMNAPSIPKTSGAVIGGIASLAMLSMAAGVAVTTMKKKRKEDK